MGANSQALLERTNRRASKVLLFALCNVLGVEVEEHDHVRVLRKLVLKQFKASDELINCEEALCIDQYDQHLDISALEVGSEDEALLGDLKCLLSLHLPLPIVVPP